jgi:hypothetical protein
LKDSTDLYIFTAAKEIQFKIYLKYPTIQPITSSDLIQQIRFNNHWQFALAWFEVQDGTLYQKAEIKTDCFSNVIQLPPWYIARTNNTFEFIGDIYRNLQYFGIQKMYKRVAERY